MNTRHSNSAIVSRGTVLVDPRATLHKLREYLLPEPAHYVLELVRVAVAGGATAIHVENDSNDLKLTFDGEPIEARELSRLLDHLFNSANRRLRLLAIAVNTALGLDPRFVDLYTTRHEYGPGTVARIRWHARNTHRAATTENDNAPTATIQPVAASDPLPESGMQVHVRERFGTAVFREFFQREPVETRLLREHTRALPIPLLRRGQPLPRTPVPPALVRVEVQRPSIQGWIALLPPRTAGNVLELCELGVLLERRELISLATSNEHHRCPLWMLIDTDELPTNASRSRVNLEGPFGQTLLQIRDEALEALVTNAVALIQSQSEKADTIREALAALLLTTTEGTRPAIEPVGPVKNAWTAPLIPLATGGFTTLQALASLPPQSTRVWEGRQPLPSELAPWMDNVVWIRDRESAIARLISLFEPVDARPAIEQARQALDRYRNFIAHPPRSPRVPTYQDELVRVAFGQPHVHPHSVDIPLQTDIPRGHEGEVVVRAPADTHEHATQVTVFIENRPLVTETLGPSPLPMEITLQAPGVRARPSFDGVEHNESFELALATARRVAVEAIAFVVTATVAPDSIRADDIRFAWLGPALVFLSPEARAALVRMALTLAITDRNPDNRRHAITDLLTQYPVLSEVPAWPTTERDRYVTTTEVVALASTEPHVLLFAPPGTVGQRSDGRPVLALATLEKEALEAVVPTSTRWIEYARYLSARPAVDPRTPLPHTNWSSSAGPWLLLHREGAYAAIAPTMQRSRLVLAHRGKVLKTQRYSSTLGRIVLVLDDDGLLPGLHSHGSFVHHLSHQGRQILETAEYDLVAVLARTLSGDDTAAQIIGVPKGSHPPESVVRLLLDALANLRTMPDDTVVGWTFPMSVSQLRECIRSAPLLVQRVIGGSLQLVSVNEVALRGRSRPVPFLRQLPTDVDCDDLEPLYIQHPAIETALASAAEITLSDASEEITRRRTVRLRQHAMAALQSQPRVTLDDDLPGAQQPVIRSATTKGRYAIAPAPLGTTEPTVQVLVGNRVAIDACSPKHCPLHPVVMRVVFANPEALTPSLNELTPTGQKALETLYQHGVDTLVRALINLARQQSITDAARAVIVRWVTKSTDRQQPNEVLAELSEAPLWLAPWGEHISAIQAVKNGRVQYTTQAFASWLPPPRGCVENAPLAVVVPTNAPFDEWIECLKKLTGAEPRDVTKTLLRIQRHRRLHAAEPSATRRIALPGSPESPALQERIEQITPELGVGEIRLVPPIGQPSIKLWLYVDGKLYAQHSLNAPIHLEVALETHLIAPTARTRTTTLPARVYKLLLQATHNLLEAALAKGTPLPGWCLPALRWHLLTSKNISPRAKQSPTFIDSTGTPMSLAEICDQITRYGAFAYTTDPPDSPRPPLDPNRRVVVLTPEEAERIGRHLASMDYTEALRNEQRARQNSPPAPVLHANYVRTETPLDGAHSLAEASLRDFEQRQTLHTANDRPLNQQVLDLLHHLGLDRHALTAITLTDGRTHGPVEYDARTKVATLSRQHPLVHNALTQQTPRALHLLAIAILGEVNRAMEAITDADEEHILVAMLENIARHPWMNGG